MLRIGIPLLGILLIFAALVTWLSNPDYMPAARQLLTQNPRVRAEFGDDVAMPFAVGWMLDDRPDIYGYVKGSQARGWLTLSSTVTMDRGKFCKAGFTTLLKITCSSFPY